MQNSFSLPTPRPDSPMARWLDLFNRAGFTVQEFGRPEGVTWAATLRSVDWPGAPLTVFRSVSRPEVDGRLSVEGLHRDALGFLLAQNSPVAWLSVEPEGGGVVMHFPSRGVDCEIHPILGWALSADFQRGPVVASANAPAPCVSDRDATNWYIRTAAQEIGAGK